MIMTGVHDIGGQDAGPIDLSDHALSSFDQRVDAMLMLLVHPNRGAFRVDALRRAIESYRQQDYDSLSYYERWLGAVRKLVVEQDILSEEEIAAKIAELKAQKVGG
jgi:hypothetical protein|tara:strand:+ start:422 stop:739 length:318 start_codon:yes stop_codon:yes gene_type:complete